ncbi:MAG: N-acetylmuramoyl-L-alanine amidase [Deltaproteobacteria bacterium]|nr:N-acetylmuramoyl-L-alanine amidase [Deltaproteobacteria bacterium]
MFHPLSKYPAYAIIIAIIVLTNCAPPRYTPSFRVEMKSLDVSPLQGRRIVIDPGHGGEYAGAVGVRGLRESDINLATGLHLWGLLNQAGSQVWLTRTADIGLCPHGKATLGKDLEARSRFSNELGADVFISIHHNSNTKDRKKNNTQIYYKLTDPGPSQDLARWVANELRKGQPLDEIYVFPGNYRVLRNNRAVAILGEASFLSNKKNEKRLSLSNQLRREAEDYFLGILTYFQKGIPEVIDHYPDGLTIDTAFPRIEARIVGGPGGESIDPETTKLYLDELLVPSKFNPQTGIISHTPDRPLKNGWHTFFVGARNYNGNVNLSKPARFRLSLPPAYLKVSSSLSFLPADGVSFSRIEVVALDCHNNPIIDNSLISLGVSAGRLDKNATSTIDGRGIAYFFSPKEPEEVEVEARGQSVISKTTISCGPIDDALVKITVSGYHHKPVDMVRVKGKETVLGTSDRNGLVFIRSDRSGEIPVTLKRPGYLPKKEMVFFKKGVFREEHFSLTPREEGLLFGRKFTLDPEPWDEKTEKISGLRPNSEGDNLLVTKKLQGFLEESGAITTLTRNSLQEHPTPGERVMAGGKFNGNYFITLTHRNDNPYVAHYFLSQTGKQVAQKIAQLLKKELKLKGVRAKEGTDFTIIHPHYPSIVVNFGEKYLCKKAKNRQAALEQEARSVYQGLVAFFREIQKK